MKKSKIINSGVAIAIICATLISSCSKKDDVVTPTTPDTVAEYDYSNILASFVDNTVNPSYADMKDNAMLLYTKVNDFQTSSSQTDIDDACAYWQGVRAPWEAGEAFLFGPAAYNNLDPLLDSWPLDQAQLDQVLNGSQTLTADFVRDGLGAVLRGFHTVEYLLFENGAPRTAVNMTVREKEYLLAVSQVLRDDCITLWALWSGVTAGSAEATILDNLGIEIGTPYGDEFKNAGKAGSRYSVQRDAVDEMLQGMIGIADEVANGKIADPHNSGNVLDVESWFSWNSLTDFKNNVRSIENTYLGGYDPLQRGISLSDFVKSQDAALDQEVITKIQNAINAIDAIPEPFRNNLNHTNVQTAIDKVNEVMDIIDSRVRPLVVS